jgi:hypothetical protein
MGVWEAVAVLVSVYEQQRWVVHALIGLLAVLFVDRLRSAEWFDRVPTLDVHVDPGESGMHAASFVPDPVFSLLF